MNSLSVEAIDDIGRLDEIAPAWAGLARRAIEPNPFFEPEYLTAAWRHLRPPGESPVVGAVWAGPPADGRLVGLIPMARTARTKGLPIPSLGTWRHAHAFLGTPLLDGSCADDAFGAILRWARERSRRACVVRFDRFGADGPFAAVLERATERARVRAYVDERFERPLYRGPRADGFEAYFERAADGVRRRKYRAWLRQLAAGGALTFAEDSGADAVAGAAGTFLDIESRGWKGEAGTSLALDPGQRRFFLDVAAAFARRGAFRALTLRVGGTPVAVRTSILSGGASFCFKTTYEQSHARSSPGTVLEVEQLRRMISDTGLSWSDSCASSHTSPLRWLWTERREIRSVILPSTGVRGRVLVALLPWLRAVARRRRSAPAAPPGGEPDAGA